VDRAFPFLRIAYFLVACLGVGMVTGACRATTLHGVVRKSAESFIAYAAGIVGIIVAIWLLSLVAQA
jgi:hypothetical protein